MGAESSIGINTSISSDLLVPQNQEKEYCQRNGIEFMRLPNGPTILGVTRPSVDTRNVEVNMYFPTGSDEDPEDQLGLTHLTEHLITNRSASKAGVNYTYFNAATSPEMLSININGVGTIRPDKGMRPVLTEVLSELSLSEETRRHIKNALPAEIGVVKQEITRKDKDHHSKASLNLLRTIFAPENLLFRNTLGTPETLANISADDVIRHAEKIFSADGTVLSFFNDGDPSVSNAITEELKAFASTLPNGHKLQRKKFDQSRYGKLNPAFQQGQTYLYNTGIDSNLVTVYFAWIIDNPPDVSPEYIAQSRIFSLVGNLFEQYMREHGLSYDQGHEWSHRNGSKILALLTYDSDIQLCGNRTKISEQNTNLSQSIRQEIVDNIVTKGFKSIMDYREFTRELVPIQKTSLFSTTLAYFMNHQQIINIDATEKMRDLVTEQLLADKAKQFVDIPPAIIISGNW